MDSKEQIIREISTVVASLSLKIEKLQAKVNELCRNTECAEVKKAHKDLLCKTTTKIKIED